MLVMVLSASVCFVRLLSSESLPPDALLAEEGCGLSRERMA